MNVVISQHNIPWSINHLLVLSVLRNVQTGSEVIPASYSAVTAGSLGVKVTTY